MNYGKMMKNKILMILVMLAFNLVNADIKINQSDTIDLSQYYMPNINEAIKTFLLFEGNLTKTSDPKILKWRRVSKYGWNISKIVNEKVSTEYMSYRIKESQLLKLDYDLGNFMKRFVVVGEDIDFYRKTKKESKVFRRQKLIEKINSLNIHGYNYIGDIIKVENRNILITGSTFADKNIVEYDYYQKGIGKIAYEKRTCQIEITIEQSMDCKVLSIEYELLTRFVSPKIECIYMSN